MTENIVFTNYSSFCIVYITVIPRLDHELRSMIVHLRQATVNSVNTVNTSLTQKSLVNISITMYLAMYLHITQSTFHVEPLQHQDQQ